MKFTDDDMQDYLEGIFTGDVTAFEEYINNTEAGKKRFEGYKTMFNLLQEGPLPVLNIKLDEAVMAALDARKRKTSFNWNIIVWGLVGCCVAGAVAAGYLFLSDLSFFKEVADSSLSALIIIAVILISLAFQGIDWYRQYRRYNKWLVQE